MDFLKQDFNIRILSVQKLLQAKYNTYVNPRPFNALSFRLSGNAVISDNENAVRLTTNDILFMPEKVPYHLRSEPETLIVIHFELEGTKQNCFERIRPRDSLLMKELFVSIYEAWNANPNHSYLKSMSIFYRILSKLDHSQATDNGDPAYIRIKPAIDYINQNFTNPELNVKRLCELANVSDTYFRRLFAHCFDSTPLNYINSMRIEYAQELLHTGYYSVEEISGKVGFLDSKYFSVLYKRKKGVPPSKDKVV